MAAVMHMLPIRPAAPRARSSEDVLDLVDPAPSKLEMPDEAQVKHAEATPSRLLCLPAELRNRIYRFVLLREDDDDRILVTEAGHERPALLQTCTKIRSEALKIFYYENSFRIDMSDYNAALLALFTHKLRVQGLETHSSSSTSPLSSPISPASYSSSSPRSYVECYLRYRDREPNWPNLLEWMRLVHAGDVPPRKLTPKERWASGRHSTVRIVISSMNNLVRCLAERPWEEVKVLLEDQRVVLGTVNAKWMEG